VISAGCQSSRLPAGGLWQIRIVRQPEAGAVARYHRRGFGYLPVVGVRRIAAGVSHPPVIFEGVKTVPFRRPVIDIAVDVVDSGRFLRQLGLERRQIENPSAGYSEFRGDEIEHHRVGIVLEGGQGQVFVGQALVVHNRIDDDVGNGVVDKHGIINIVHLHHGVVHGDGIGGMDRHRIAGVDGVDPDYRVGRQFDIFGFVDCRFDDLFLVAAAYHEEYRNDDEQ